MTGGGGASPGPAPTPVEVRGRRPPGWVALGLLAAALVALVAIALAGQSGGRPGSEAAVATPVATSSPTAPPAPAPGTPPPRVAVSLGPVPTCPPGSNPDEPGPIDQVAPPVYGWSPMAFDRRAGRLIALAANTEGDQETWTFDVCTNTWTRMHPDREPPALVSELVYDVDTDLTIGVQYEDWHPYEVIGSVWAYDLEANTWTEHGEAPTTGLGFYDPVAGVVFAGDWNYDVETDTWTPARQAIAREGPDCGTCAYDLSVDRVIAYGSLEEGVLQTWLLDLRTGAWSKSGAETPDCTMHAWALSAIVYDEAAERTVVTGAFNMCAYDAAADRWEILQERDPSGSLPMPTVYDPVNRRLIVFGGGIGISGDLVAFDLVNREWTVLLKPGTGRAAP